MSKPQQRGAQIFARQHDHNIAGEQQRQQQAVDDTKGDSRRTTPARPPAVERALQARAAATRSSQRSGGFMRFLPDAENDGKNQVFPDGKCSYGSLSFGRGEHASVLLESGAPALRHSHGAPIWCFIARWRDSDCPRSNNSIQKKLAKRRFACAQSLPVESS